jgi:hypothetical protein
MTRSGLILKCSIFVLVFCLAGCGTKTTIKTPHGEEYTVRSHRKAMVVLEKEGEKITVDNRGRAGFIEQVFGALLINVDRSDVAGEDN